MLSYKEIAKVLEHCARTEVENKNSSYWHIKVRVYEEQELIYTKKGLPEFELESFKI